MINETRASTERRMLGDVRELLRQGEEVNQQDSQGATLVRRANKKKHIKKRHYGNYCLFCPIEKKRH